MAGIGLCIIAHGIKQWLVLRRRQRIDEFVEHQQGIAQAQIESSKTCVHIGDFASARAYLDDARLHIAAAERARKEMEIPT
jgi:hypothetical protein